MAGTPMGADDGRQMTLLGLEVKDDAGYARYRQEMTPILARYGGGFGCDFVIAEVLVGPNPRINRVFTIAFPDRGSRERFFADPQYRAARSRCWKPTRHSLELDGYRPQSFCISSTTSRGLFDCAEVRKAAGSLSALE